MKNDNFQNSVMVLFLNRLTQLGLVDLWVYVVRNNPTKNIAYHNNQHMLYMAWLADGLYQGQSPEEQAAGNHREMIAAALFHDYNHTAGVSHDSVNIERAVEAWRIAYLELLPKDIDRFEVELLIRATEYPYTHSAESLAAKCLRDADLLYTTVMGDPFIVLRGLKAEMETSRCAPITETEMANGYKEFIRKAEIHTEQGQLLRLSGFPVLLLSMALRCDGVEVVSPDHAEAWLKG